MINPTLNDAWNDYAERSGLTIDGVAYSPAKAQSAYFAFEAGWNRRAQPEGKAIELLKDAARAWNNEADAELDATMERIECFLLDSRAQPEGEAPQAVAVARLLELAAEENADAGASIQHGASAADVPEWAQLVDKLFAPGAPHAESGAPASDDIEAAARAIYELLPPCQGKSAKDFPWQPGGNSRKQEEARDYAWAALAAQSQGAQAAPNEATVEAMKAILFSGRLVDTFMIHDLYRAAQQAEAPGALDLLNAEELAALHRFQETCEDSEGYDVGKDMMKRLAAIGVIESKGFNRYQFTEFGDYVVENRAPSAPGTPEAPQTAAARDVLAERQRQIEVEGWTPEHDDMNGDGQMAVAAGYYALACGYPHERDIGRGQVPSYWPWEPSWWKPRTKRENLVRSGALVLAEIERLDRAAQLDAAPEAPKGGA